MGHSGIIHVSTTHFQRFQLRQAVQLPQVIVRDRGLHELDDAGVSTLIPVDFPSAFFKHFHDGVFTFVHGGQRRDHDRRAPSDELCPWAAA